MSADIFGSFYDSAADEGSLAQTLTDSCPTPRVNSSLFADKLARATLEIVYRRLRASHGINSRIVPVAFKLNSIEKNRKTAL